MDLTKVLAELKKELENLDAAIVSLEKLEVSTRKRGGAGSAPEVDERADPELPAALLTSKPRRKGSSA
jgi:isoaspartyl peptidase/L-asparaginase-like protein (Ntn-hydrolase superfamily)